jgi:purine nucleosidase
MTDRALLGKDAELVQNVLAQLEPPAGVVRVVLDTDAYNEIDDQFAIAYAIRSPRLAVEAVYAAPFHNQRSTGAGDGMRRSYDEITRLLDLLGVDPALAHHGATQWMAEPATPVRSAATDDLISRAMSATQDAPLYVVAIGAPTNVASAVIAAPEIADRIVVVWLGGNPSWWHRASEFNLDQDPAASRVILDCLAPLVRVPCVNVAEHLRTSFWELREHLDQTSPLGRYLLTIFENYYDDHRARSKEIWDIGPVAWLVDPGWTVSTIVHSPVVTDAGSWAQHPGRPLSREIWSFHRDPVFADLFDRLAG